MKSSIHSCDRKIQYPYLWVGLGGCLLLVWSCFTTPWLLLNMTPSIPMGIYRIQKRVDIEVEDLIVFRFNERWLIKEVIGVAGDVFCVTQEGDFTLNGKRFGVALERTRPGKRLKRQVGCQPVAHEEWVVFGYGDRSFDSRYFGAVKQQAILGKAVPFWVKSFPPSY